MQVPIELVLQEPAHLRRPVFVLLHHQRRVLREGLIEHGHALHVGADQLMRPPLVRHLVRRHVEHVVDVIGIAQVRNKADGLGEWHGIGETLGKLLVVRKLQHPHLAELKRRIHLAEMCQRLLHRLEHAIDVVGVLRVVVDLQCRAIPAIAPDRVARRLERKVIEDRLVHLVVEVVPPVLSPLLVEIAGRQCDLIGAGRDGRLKRHPVGVATHQTVAIGSRVVDLRHPRHGSKAVLAPVVAVLELTALVVAEVREHGVVDERAVLDHVRVGRRIAEAATFELQLEVEIHRRTGSERRLQLVDREAVHLIVTDEVVRRKIECQHLHLDRQQDVQVADRDRGLVGERVVTAYIHASFARVDVDVGAHVGYSRLRHVLVRAIAALVVGLLFLGQVARNVAVDDVGVVEDEAAKSDETG